MTDRELLEMAAKAAGQERGAAGDLWSNARGLPWNPLKDDGDALRLAVKLGLILNLSPREDCRGQTVVTFDGLRKIEEPCADGRDRAARRAIVRAAAEIGKAKP